MNSEKSAYLRIIHRELNRQGFCRQNTIEDHHYKKTVEIKAASFPVTIVISDPFFVTKPLILLDRKPDGLPVTTPHLFFDKALCYLDDRGYEFDRYNPEYNIKVVLEALSQLLNSYVEEPDLLQQEIRRELPLYWNSDTSEVTYIASTHSDALQFSFYEHLNLKGKSVSEIVIADDSESISTWISKRNGVVDENAISGPAFIVNLPDNITFDLNTWPPKSYSDVLTWLNKSKATPARQRFINKVFMAILEHHRCIVLFRLLNMHLGCYLSFASEPSRTVLKEKSRFRGSKKQRGKKVFTATEAQKISLITAIERYEKKNGFHRLMILDVRPSQVVTRNLTQSNSLSDLRIGLIGCGTLGGYTASLLIQAGAASGIKEFTLFDPDTLHPENLGRHILGVEYLGENKAVALADSLSKQSVTKLCIYPVEKKFSKAEFRESITKFDVLIDTTGDITFSTNLCHYMHHNGNAIPVIYGWIDAGGLAARALIDIPDRNSSCYACLKTRDTFGQLVERYPLFKPNVEIPSWQPRPCGIGGYLPYSSQASVSGAGLVQGMALDFANERKTPSFRHISLDQRVISTKDSTPKPLKNCPCCQN